ncbi:MAG: hypothetical protein WB609_09435 [Candidatus Cybelea sp.]
MLRIAAALVFALSLLAPTPAATRTQTVIFMPWTRDGLGHHFGVAAKVKGACFAHSRATSRPDAWRCSARDDVYDPCFEGLADTGEVACVETPFSTSIVLIRLGKPLAASSKSFARWLEHKGVPWGLRLAGGDKCVYVTGASYLIAGKRLNYACERSGWVAGVPDRAVDLWTVQTVSAPGEKHLVTLPISTAVF